MSNYKVSGPKGGTIAKHASAGKVARLLPKWARLYKKVSVQPTSAAKPPTVDKRQKLLQYLHWGIANNAQIHYGEVRPITRVKPGQLPKLPWTTDCSGSGTTLCQAAGIPDPNGNNYNGSGFTGSLLAHLKHIPAGRLKIGDPVVFGCHSYKAGHHVTWVTEIRSRKPEGIICFSHGSERGPFSISVADEAAYQPDGLSGVIYLTLGV